MKTLNDLRDELDGIDRELVALLCKRMGVSREVALVKRRAGVAVLDAGREAEVVRSRASLACAPLRPVTAAFFRQIMAMSRLEQESALGTSCVTLIGSAGENTAEIGKRTADLLGFTFVNVRKGLFADRLAPLHVVLAGENAVLDEENRRLMATRSVCVFLDDEPSRACEHRSLCVESARHIVAVRDDIEDTARRVVDAILSERF